MIDSIANIKFAAGATRFAAPHSRFLFHGVVMNISQAVEVTYPKLSELKNTLESDQMKMVEILKERTNLLEREILHFFNEGSAKDAEFARAKGIVHDVLLPEIPEGASLFSFQNKWRSKYIKIALSSILSLQLTQKNKRLNPVNMMGNL